jgi:hypothetical protein
VKRINGRLYASVAEYGDHQEVTHVTVQNWLRLGHIEGYRVKGIRGVLIDIEAADAELAKLPPTVVRPGRKAFGPKARIKNIAVIVEEAS